MKLINWGLVTYDSAINNGIMVALIFGVEVYLALGLQQKKGFDEG